MAIGGAEQAVRESLRRIAARDVVVRAWLHVDERGALAQAQRLDNLDGDHGLLHGIPIGVKDVFDTCDMPTTYNSPLFGGHQPSLDAACVETLRAAGAIILGKTDTTEFAAAGRDAVSANPHDLARTPGGSSAGSAAAVADGHVRIALATQTGGSTIRPASFCGIHGFKPSWGLVSREGVKLYANSLDTVGWHARSLDDCDLLCQVLGFTPPPKPEPERENRPLRLAFCRTPWWDQATSDGQAAVLEIVDRLRGAGAVIEDLTLPPLFATLAEAHHVILWREGAAAFRNLGAARPDLLHADFHKRIASVTDLDDRKLRDAYDRAAEGRVIFEELAADFDAVLTPSAPGVAPIGRAPGNPIFNQLWTLLHVPVVSLPLARAESGLPIGISLVGARFEDRRLLEVARAVEALVPIIPA